MLTKLAFGMIFGATTGVVIECQMLDSLSIAFGLGCSVTGIMRGAQFGFASNQDDDEA